MRVSPNQDQLLHHKLPIDADEQILGVYKHHWFAYASSWLIGIVLALVIMIAGIAIAVSNGNGGALADYRGDIVGGAAVLAVLVLAGAAIPVYLRSQEELVLTQETLLQVLQPSLFASRVDQVSLQRTDSIAVRQDLLGTMFGYGHITVETPGEQDDYEFFMVPRPHDVVREITAAKENYEAALNAGRIPTTLGTQPAALANDAEYQQFLQWKAQQAAQPPAQTPEQK